MKYHWFSLSMKLIETPALRAGGGAATRRPLASKIFIIEFIGYYRTMRKMVIWSIGGILQTTKGWTQNREPGYIITIVYIVTIYAIGK